MPLVPGKTKFRKNQRRRLKGRASIGCTLHFGEFGLQTLDCAHLTVNQIEAARKTMAHYFKRGGKIWVRLLADKTMTSRPAETRMGGGKGAPAMFVAPVRRGRILFEVAGVKKEDAIEAFRLAGHKLPVMTRFVEKV